MLNIRTIRNSLITDSEKDGFCFRSVCSQNLSTERLAGEMADYNSSFTEADILGMLSVLGTVVVKYVAKGYSVELPFGTLRANATGTCASIQDGFSAGTRNHQLGILFSADEAALSAVRSGLEYRQVAPDTTGEAKIYRVTALQSDASESEDLNVAAGRTLRLHGRNLSFDMGDAAQGVFLESEDGVSRMDTYNRRGSNIVDFVIPAALAPGRYGISLVAKPGTMYFTASFNSEITVS